MAPHRRLEWPRGVRSRQTEEGRPSVCGGNPREQRLREGGWQREDQGQGADHGVANQGVFDSQAGPQGIGADRARDTGSGAVRSGTLLSLPAKKGSGTSRSLSCISRRFATSLVRCHAVWIALTLTNRRSFPEVCAGHLPLADLDRSFAFRALRNRL